MKILGISAHYHDPAAALVIDGMPIAAVQEERLSRRKNDAAFPLLAIEWCLDHAGIGPEALGIQSVNLAVSDYSNDQSYLRLAVELPRFREPVAVVTLFMPSLADRNLLENRPHPAAGLIWQPADRHWRLAALLRWLLPYRSSAAVEQGITRTRDSLCALVDLARARGALPLIVVPQFGPESATEEMLRRRILDETGLPYVHVKLDPSWHLPGDLHPDPRAAQAIAISVAGRLHGRYADGKPPGRAYSR